MFIKDVKVYGYNESLVAAGYPKRTDIDINHSLEDDIVNMKVPKGIESLATCEKGSGHDNFLKGIIVQFDLCISDKAWKDIERYRFLDFVSSCSEMHKITNMNIDKCCNNYVYRTTIDLLKRDIEDYNGMTAKEKNSDEGKELYLKILYNVPSGFELCARMSTNYLQLKTIYSQRRHHRLLDFQMICDWIESLPDSHLITGKKKEDDVID